MILFGEGCVLLLKGLKSNGSFTMDLVQGTHAQKMKHLLLFCYFFILFLLLY